ncbi:MAG TPA: ABC transporter ATP-binding protein [Steroidobacteraceae bacterium]|nr:ABC transporter ATP-binding protein [Steroidobacteraceae bacterium]
MVVLLESRGIDIVVQERMLVRALDLTVQEGTITALLGRNGAGKTLTMHTLAGLRASARGEIQLAQRPLAQWPRKALARQLGLLTQTSEDPFPATVMELVLMGRSPHLGFWDLEDEADRQIARQALAQAEIEHLETRDITTLSGGERRRVALALLLTQDPRVLLLDEPLNHLDPHHQLHILEVLQERAARGRGVVMSLHDAGMAARFAQQAVLLFGDGDWLSGPANEVLTAETIGRLYGVKVRELQWEGGRTFVAEG